jgi:hypothetical protein
LLANRLRTFVAARAFLGAIAAILDVILLLVLGVPAALLWGLLSFLLSFIPNVGFVVSLIPPTILALLIGGPTLALAVIVGYTVINLAIDYVVQPRFIGGSVDISPVIVTVSIVFWAGVLGGAGALLAVPLTLIVVALADAFDTPDRCPACCANESQRPPSSRRKASPVRARFAAYRSRRRSADGDPQTGPRVGADVAAGVQLTGTARFKSSA